MSKAYRICLVVLLLLWIGWAMVWFFFGESLIFYLYATPSLIFMVSAAFYFTIYKPFKRYYTRKIANNEGE